MSDLFTLAVCLDASMEGTGGRYDGPLYSLCYVEHYLRNLSRAEDEPGHDHKPSSKVRTP